MPVIDIGLVLACMFAALCSWILVGTITVTARRRGNLDVPGERQSHTMPTPTGGGIGIIASLAVFSAACSWFRSLDSAWMQVVVPSTALLSLMGWLDDQKPLSASLRLLVQLGVSLGLLAFLGSGSVPIDWPVILLGGLALTWIMNFYNFMDGSHGMAGFQGVFSGIFLGVLFVRADALHLAAPALLLASVCAGFLPRNFPVAEVFMGDAGSVPLGFAIGALALLGLHQQVLTLPMAALVLSVFAVDSTMTLLKRVIRKERWYTAHKQHAYQQLIVQGWSHSRVLLLYQTINLVVVVPVAVLVNRYPEYAWHLAGLMYLLMVTGWFLASPRLEVRN